MVRGSELLWDPRDRGTAQHQGILSSIYTTGGGLTLSLATEGSPGKGLIRSNGRPSQYQVNSPPQADRWIESNSKLPQKKMLCFPMVLRLPHFVKEYWGDPGALARWTPAKQAAKPGKSQNYGVLYVLPHQEIPRELGCTCQENNHHKKQSGLGSLFVLTDLRFLFPAQTRAAKNTDRENPTNIQPIKCTVFPTCRDHCQASTEQFMCPTLLVPTVQHLAAQPTQALSIPTQPWRSKWEPDKPANQNNIPQTLKFQPASKPQSIGVGQDLHAKPCPCDCLSK